MDNISDIYIVADRYSPYQLQILKTLHGTLFNYIASLVHICVLDATDI